MVSIFWTNLIFILVWIGGWIYLALLYLAKPHEFKFLKKNVLRQHWFNLVAVVILLVSPFFWVNFHQDDGYYNYKRRFEKVLEDGSIANILSFHEYAVYEWPDNPRVNIEYMIFAANYRMNSWLSNRAAFFSEKIRNNIEPEKYQLLSQFGSIYSGLPYFDYARDLQIGEELQPLYYYVNAEKELKKGNLELAQEYFIKVLGDDELQDLAFDRLEIIWNHYYTLEELSKYAYDMQLFPYMPYTLKSQVYIKDKEWGWYFFNGFYRDFLSADLAAYLAVGFSLFVWMIFISQMLFVRKEKWKLIIPLFILGSILPILVYPLSDLLRFVYNSLGIEYFHNDLLYCVVNIGMVEELVKVLPWLIFFLVFKKHFHRPVHFMLLPVVSALGFAFSENLIYVNSTDYELVFVRSGISLIMHISCSSIIGYMAWRSSLKKKSGKKLTYLIGGFLLASFLHGLFDFIIFNRGGYLNIIILLITLHLFILFTNNAINFSGIRDKNAIRQLRHAGALLLVGLLATFLIQYLIIGWNFSPSAANYMFYGNIIFALVTAIYLVAMFSKIRLRPRVLYKFSLQDVFGQFMTTSKGNYFDEVDYLDCEFRLFAPKINKYVGNQLPVRATAIKRVVVQRDMNWWLVRFDTPVYVSGAEPYFAIMKAKESDEDLFMDKVEIMLMMIPNFEQFNLDSNYHTKDFLYVGRVYSRPLVVAMNNRNI